MVAAGVGGQGGHDVAVAVQFHFGQADGVQFFHQVFGKLHLPRRAGGHVRVLVRSRREADVLQKSVRNVHIRLCFGVNLGAKIVIIC